MQILNFLITLTVNLGIAFCVFFFLLLVLNGYSEQQATPGLILYIVLGLFFSLLATVLSVWSSHYLTTKKGMNSVAAVAIACSVFIVVGSAAIVVGAGAAVGLIEALR